MNGGARRTERRAPRAVAVACLAVLAMGGCTTGTTGTTPSAPAAPSRPTATSDGPSSRASASPDPAARRAQVLRDGIAFASGDVALVALVDPGTAATPDDDASADDERWTLEPRDPAGDALALTLAAPDGLELDVQLDDSVVVRDAAGPVAGLVVRGGDVRRTGQVLEVRADGSATVWLASRTVDALAWGEREGGRSLAVTPSDWARVGGLAAHELMPVQLAAAEPDAGTATMRGQLACHQLGAPDKATWNLEPWRPAVDSLEMIAARCNPT
ncbi:DUF2599 domain-containing protein [Cellulomonas sp.]|uniref:DUF2599 domain-containing protein n=1 Tax=Cellulomonas sp. TaxID=40001 RepID=UPI002588F22C|nr:DUF2599 domain-containing protein [Cellulomonas sp.]MCR6689016.1 DUF2599 domain-containing protein [Cellulomonas sp.]